MCGMIGGWVGEGLVGRCGSVLYGGMLIMVGDMVVGLVGGIRGVLVWMGVMVMGSGLLKGKVWNMVGDL